MNRSICKKQRFRGSLDNYQMDRVSDNFGTLQVIHYNRYIPRASKNAMYRIF